MAREQPDVLCLQEIKAARDHIPKTVCDLPATGATGTAPRGTRASRCTCARRSRPTARCTFTRISISRRASRSLRVGGILVASIYVPNGGKDFAAKMRFLEAMAAYAGRCARPATGSCCAATSTSRARRWTCTRRSATTASWASAPTSARCSSACWTVGGLHDVGRERDPDNDALFTWWAPWRNMRQRNIGWRLDYVLASGGLAAAASRLRVDARVRHQRSRARGGDVRSEGVDVMIIVSDFDGTLTIEDVTTFDLGHVPALRLAREAAAPTYDGTWTPLEMIAHGYGDIRVPPKELLAEIEARVRLRPGVEALATFCRGRGWHFSVVSHGLSFYIEALLPSWIPFSSFVGTFAEWSWQRVVAARCGPGARRGFQDPHRSPT